MHAEMIEISREVYQKLAYRDTTEGIIAVAKSKSLRLEDLRLGDNPLILVAEAPEKPGNIGAMLRTADAANLDAVIIADPKSDMYNPNIVRSGVGCLFTNQVATGTTDEVIEFLTSRQINMYCTFVVQGLYIITIIKAACFAYVGNGNAVGFFTSFVKVSFRQRKLNLIIKLSLFPRKGFCILGVKNRCNQ